MGLTGGGGEVVEAFGGGGEALSGGDEVALEAEEGTVEGAVAAEAITLRISLLN